MSAMTETVAPLVMDRLKAETRADHDATEAIGFSRHMVNQTLPRERYVWQLRAYRVIHDHLEDAMAQSDDARVRSVWRDDLAKAPLLQRDVSCFADVAPTPQPVLDEVDAYAAALRRVANEDPVALLGHLYVFEGSTLGATILRKHVAEMYDITTETGMAYYTPYGNEVMPHWKAFKARMNDAITEPDDQDRVVAAANDAFRRIGRVLQLLSPEE